ncbi:MAG: hypothetical protein U0T81_07235 [Saprospiraceae bacterium]
MGFQDKINNDLKEAMKAKDEKVFARSGQLKLQFFLPIQMEVARK